MLSFFLLFSVDVNDYIVNMYDVMRSFVTFYTPNPLLGVMGDVEFNVTIIIKSRTLIACLLQLMYIIVCTAEVKRCSCIVSMCIILLCTSLNQCLHMTSQLSGIATKKSVSRIFECTYDDGTIDATTLVSCKLVIRHKQGYRNIAQ